MRTTQSTETVRAPRIFGCGASVLFFSGGHGASGSGSGKMVGPLMGAGMTPVAVNCSTSTASGEEYPTITELPGEDSNVCGGTGLKIISLEMFQKLTIFCRSENKSDRFPSARRSNSICWSADSLDNHGEKGQSRTFCPVSGRPCPAGTCGQDSKRKRIAKSRIQC